MDTTIEMIIELVKARLIENKKFGEISINTKFVENNVLISVVYTHNEMSVKGGMLIQTDKLDLTTSLPNQFKSFTHFVTWFDLIFQITNELMIALEDEWNKLNTIA